MAQAYVSIKIKALLFGRAFYIPMRMKMPRAIKTTGTMIRLYFLMKLLRNGREESLCAIKHHSADIMPKITNVTAKSKLFIPAKSGVYIPMLSPPAESVSRKMLMILFPEAESSSSSLSNIAFMPSRIGIMPSMKIYLPSRADIPEAKKQLTSERNIMPRKCPIYILYFRALTAEKSRVSIKISSILVLKKATAEMIAVEIKSLLL